LNKIKSAASEASGDQSGATKEKADQDQETKQPATWNALKDDYLMDSKKVCDLIMNRLLDLFVPSLICFFDDLQNWDEESSDEDGESSEGEEGAKKTEAKGKEQSKKKRRRR
jgi:hypothetical protein